MTDSPPTSRPSRRTTAASAGARLLLAGCWPEATVIPTSFSGFNSTDGVFACEYPGGWEANGKAARGASWAKFTSGPALIAVRSNAAGSLMSDAMGGTAANINAPAPEFTPVHLIHQAALKELASEYPGYADQPGSPAEFDCPLGPARLSEFTYSGTYSGPMHGYRLTAITNKKGVHAVCLCRESDWAALRPAFDHFLATLDRGEQQ